MKPDLVGGEEHPLEFAVIHGLETGIWKGQPVVYGTDAVTDEQLLDWVREDPERIGLGPAAVSRLLMPNTTKTRFWVMRFAWCPACREWSPCHYRLKRDC